MHHHPVDLSGCVQRWRAAPEALPALIRDHHAATPADRRPPEHPPEPDNDGPSAALLGILVAFAIYVIAGVLYGLWTGGAA